MGFYEMRVHAPLLWAGGLIWPPLCLLIVVGRLTTRKAQRANLGPDDWLVIPALILVLGFAALILVGVGEQSLGYPTPPAPNPEAALTSTSPQETLTKQLFFIGTLIQIPILGFIKMSAIFFYGRVFDTGGNSTLRITLHMINGLLVLWTVGFFFSWTFGCGTNFDYLWRSVLDQEQCMVNYSNLNLAMAISDVIMDIIVLIFPIPLIARLHTSTTNKLAILGVFVLGALAIAMSIARLVIYVQVLNVEFDITADTDFLSTSGLYFMYLEGCFGLCAICLPSLSGAWRLKGVQTMVAGFRSIFSSAGSRSSDRSRPQHRPDQTRNGPGKLDSSTNPSNRSASVVDAKNERGHNVELHPWENIAP